jgi:hypothetical protein
MPISVTKLLQNAIAQHRYVCQKYASSVLLYSFVVRCQMPFATKATKVHKAMRAVLEVCEVALAQLH